MTSRTLTYIGITALLLYAAVTGVRCAASVSWLPRGTLGVVWFVAELLLIPLGIVLLAWGLLWRLVERRGTSNATRCEQKRTPQREALAGVILVVALVSALLFARAVFPVLSRKLEWGRYGFQPPVPVRSLEPITDKLGLHLPEGTRVVKGEFMSGPHNHLFAVLEMPRAGAEGLLHQSPFREGIVSSADDLPLGLPPEFTRSVAGKSHVVYAAASFPLPTDVCAMAVDLSDADRALVYLYWVRTVEDWNW